MFNKKIKKISWFEFEVIIFKKLTVKFFLGGNYDIVDM